MGALRPDGCATVTRAPGRSRQLSKGNAVRVVCDYDLCESNAICMGILPEVFEVRDDDFLYILNENPPEEWRDKVEEAVRRCPKQALSIVED